MISLYKKLRMYGFKTFIVYSVKEITRKIWIEGIKKSFSQSGEDLVIDTLLRKKSRGFYVDVGAYDPNRFSNTKRFYQRGWKGINIEPDVNNYHKFLRQRKRDINLNLGVGLHEKKLTFFRLFPDTLSTFSQSTAKMYEKEGFKIIEKSVVPVRKLSSIFRKYCHNQTVDFLSVDTEGTDLEVLESNQWRKFRPRIICVELILPSDKSIKRDVRINRFLGKIGYKKFKDVSYNTIYFDGGRREFSKFSLT